MRRDLSNRLFDFSVECIKLVRILPNSVEYKVIKYQLTKSSTSAGANYEESQAGSSRADFANKIRIALREMRESNYWLRIIEVISDNANVVSYAKKLVEESEELKKILGAISKKTKSN